MTTSPGGIEYDESDLEALYRAVGFVVIQWGQAEQGLEMIVAILHHELDGKKLHKRIPMMLQQKLEYARTCAENLPSLAALRGELEALISKFERLKETRHNLIHGAVASVTPTAGAFQFTKLNVVDGQHVAKTSKLSAEDFPSFAEDLVSLGREVSELGWKLLELAEPSTVRP